MPFTVSHIIAVVPFRCAGMPFMALAVGSMAPDIFYFIPGWGVGRIGHLFPWGVLYSLLLGLMVFALFQCVARRPLLLLFPPQHQPLMAELTTYPPGRRNLWLVPVLMLAGIVTHLVWDSFTHLSGAGTLQFPLLASAKVSTPIGALPLYKFLQYSCSVAGLVLLGAWYLWLLRHQPVRQSSTPSEVSQLPPFVRRGVRLVLFAAPAAMAAWAFHRSGAGPQHETFLQWAKDCGHETIAGAGTALIAVTALYCLVWHGWQRAVRRSG